MRRNRIKQRQQLLFHPPVKVPKWERLTHNVQRRVISRLVVMLRQHRVCGTRAEKEIDHE